MRNTIAQGNNRKRSIQKIRRRRNLKVALLLIFAFPYGLYVMWKGTRWPRSAKTMVTAAIACLLLLIALPVTNPPERQFGMVSVNAAKVQEEVFGPEAPAHRQPVEIYAPVRTALFVEPTPTPTPVYVYCNAGGRYYHGEKCAYVKNTTPVVTLTQAGRAGYAQCPNCDAPSEDGYA